VNTKITIEEELRLYKQALTKAISLPKGVLPDGDNYYTWMNNGNCIVEKKRKWKIRNQTEYDTTLT